MLLSFIVYRIYGATYIATETLPELPQSFFARPAEVVAPELIGGQLVKRQADGELLWGVVVETEAYSQGEPPATATTAAPPATPPGTAPAKEKPPSQYLSILQRSDCREVRATGASQVTAITIRLPDVEAAMLVEVQKVNRSYRGLQGLLVNQIQAEYQKTPAARAKRQA